MEESTGAEDAPQGAFGSLLRLLALIGGWVIVALMIYTVADVILRYIFNRPFSGSIEVTEFAMAVIVFLGIAWCGWLGGHVAVDILERPLEDPRLRFVPVILTFIGGVLFLAIAWLTIGEALSTVSRVSNMMRWPHYPFQFVVALGSAMYAVVLFIQCVRMLRKPPGGEGGSHHVAQ
ncbi:MAG: TRAP transporter small permease [Xanthobacteraceae bacterium]|nr:TRAP transporter small permease [Xanthobacteraceae bacterium]